MLKRIFDLLFSSLAILILSPFLLIIAVLIKLDSPGPVLFIQERVGKDLKLIKVCKFRTMSNKTNKRGLCLTCKHDPRITKVGRFLRAFKIDELPQLFNVIKGDMSIVGPRPEAPKLVKHYSETEKALFSIKPGITSEASIKFIEEEKYLPKSSRHIYEIYYKKILPRKLECDLKYLKEQSLWTDIKIIILTIGALLSLAITKSINK